MRPSKNMIKTSSIGEYIKKNQERKNAHWVFRDNELYFEFQGALFREDQFDLYYPLYVYHKYNEKGGLIGKNYLL